MKSGIVLKGIGGFYYVYSEGEIYECRARGLLRKEGISPMAGDYVTLSDEGDSLIEILPRRTFLERPPVANVDRVVVVAASEQPKPDLFFIDRLLVTLAYRGIGAMLCVNKTDMDEGETARELAAVYKDAGIEIIASSALLGHGVTRLAALLKGKVTALAGNSGVGKSSLLNKLIYGLELETGVVSEKTRRGKHTTRHVELIPLSCGGYVVDTPGFSILEPKGLPAQDVKNFFPEFSRFEGECRFRGCTHTAEPGCKVRLAAEKDEIAKSRMSSYERLYEELKKVKSWE